MKAIRQVTDKPEEAQIITAAWASNTATLSGSALLNQIEAYDIPEIEKDAMKHHLAVLRQSLIMLGMLGDPDTILVELFGEKVPVEIVDWDPYSDSGKE